MKAAPIIIAVGIIVIGIAAWVGYVMAAPAPADDPKPPGEDTTAPADKDDTAKVDDQGEEGRDGPGDRYLVLAGRAEDAVLELAGKDASWRLPALPEAGSLTWLRSWEFRGAGGKAKVEATWRRSGEAVVLTDIRRPGKVSIAELTASFTPRLTLSGALPADAKEKAELERMARQLLFLLRSLPAGEIKGGDEKPMGGQPFRFVPLDGTRALLVAADHVDAAKQAYPAEVGVFSEVQLTRSADGAFVAAARIVANRRPEAGTENVERLELR